MIDFLSTPFKNNFKSTDSKKIKKKNFSNFVLFVKILVYCEKSSFIAQKNVLKW